MPVRRPPPRRHARREAAALPCGAGPLIPFLVRHFDAALGAGTTAGNVLAGYLAHLLGCLTAGGGVTFSTHPGGGVLSLTPG